MVLYWVIFSRARWMASAGTVPTVSNTWKSGACLQLWKPQPVNGRGKVTAPQLHRQAWTAFPGILSTGKTAPCRQWPARCWPRSVSCGLEGCTSRWAGSSQGSPQTCKVLMLSWQPWPWQAFREPKAKRFIPGTAFLWHKGVPVSDELEISLTSRVDAHHR